MSSRRGLPPSALTVSYVLIVVVPLLASIAVEAGHGRITMRAAAATGMASGVMILLQMVSSGRFEAISGRIGIDVTMAFHKWAAPVALVLAIAHVGLLVGPPDAERPHRFLRRLGAVLTGEGLWDARIALLLLVLLVLLALIRDRLPFRYEIWRAGHALGALGLIGFMLWHILGDGRGHTLTAAIWVLLALAASLPALWVYARRLTRPASLDWRVAAVGKVADRLWEVTLDNPMGGRLQFRAGQFAWAAFGGRRLPLYDHPLSIASDPGEPRLSFLVQEAGDFTERIGSLAPGTRVALDAPHGSFGLEPRGDDAILLIAGGVGIAPILSVLSELARTGRSRPVRLVYAARSPEAMVPARMFRPACARLGIRPMLLVDHDAPAAGLVQGPLTEAHLRQALEGVDPARAEVLICGPGPMMTMTTDTLFRLGVPLSRIDYERFSYSTRELSSKDRRMLASFGAIWTAIAALIVGYSLS
jgi:predicted ferric reductase